MSKKQVDIDTALAVDAAQTNTEAIITLSTGVVLKCKQAPSLTLVKVMGAFPRPKPPVWINKQVGREMENPDDPDYIERLRAWQMESSNAILNALVLLGTELVSKPKGFPGPNEDAWLDEYQLLGVPMLPENKSWRYLTWVTFKAAIADSDMDLIKEAVGKLSGIPEQKVKAAEEFPGSNPE
jgi:hypothetical protein